jgi:hypothetical protein
MSGFVRAGFSFLKNLGKGGSKTSPTISSTKINVGNLKKNQETLNKLKKTTDAYVTKAGSVDPSLKEALRKAGSKSLQKTEKILRKNRKDGGRIGRRFGGGADMGKKKTNVQKIKETFAPKKQLSPKQMKIASLAGNKKKIDGPDFAKLRSKKT